MVSAAVLRPYDGLSHDEIACLPDEGVYEMVQAGSGVALRVLIERHTGMLRRMAKNIIGNEHEADDVVQDVFVTLWKTRDAWERTDAKFSTWLYRVGINKAIDHRRRIKATPADPEVLVRTLDAAQDEPDDGLQQAVIEDRQLAAQLRLAVARLPEAQRAALQLFYFEDCSIEDIAERLDASEQAVRSLLKRGRQALREHLRRDKKISAHDHHGIRRLY